VRALGRSGAEHDGQVPLADLVRGTAILTRTLRDWPGSRVNEYGLGVSQAAP
jgi:hypothetical protein